MPIRRIVLLALVLWALSLSGCRAKEQAPPMNPDIQGVIFDAEQGQAFAQDKSDRAFRPTEQDVHRAEDALPKFLAEPLDPETKAKRPWEEEQRRKILAKLSTYKRQWAGLARDRKRVLYMNFFCHTHDVVPWRTTAVFVDDGGDCYFQVEFDLDTGRFENLRVNGEA